MLNHFSKEKNRVLVVDDDRTIRVSLTFLFKSFGWETCSSSSVPEAMERLNAEKYDLVISDYQMPDMDGLELLRQVKQLSGKAAPIVFIFSSFMDRPTREEAFSLGATRVLDKSSGTREMHEALKSCGMGIT
jgi:CheY-like chemotaxis protein